MRIGLIIYGSLDTVSGGYLYDRMLVQALQRAGHPVQILSQPWQNYGRHLAHNFNRAFWRQLQQAQIDLLLQDELNHPSLVWLNGRFRQQYSTPIVSIVHHLRSSEHHPRRLLPLYRLVERHYLRGVDGFIFNSQTTRRVVQQLGGGERPFVVATPGGDRWAERPSPAQIRARCYQPGPLRLLFLGSITPRKGLHHLIQALAGLPRQGWQLSVVGHTGRHPGYLRQIQQQITAANLSQFIQFCGPLSDEKLPAILRKSQLLLLLSDYEGFGIVTLEGMAFGLPAIASQTGATPEVVQHGETGYLFAADDAARIAAQIWQLHENRAQLARLSLAAQQHFLASPTWAESMARAVKFLEQFIDRQSQ